VVEEIEIKSVFCANIRHLVGNELHNVRCVRHRFTGMLCWGQLAIGW
jgi:hypothetical protein